MSLINQMLRDLESRRQNSDRQLPSGEAPSVHGRQVASRRWVFLAGAGVLLAGAIWAGQEFLSQPDAGATRPSAVVVPVAIEKSQPVAVAVADQKPAALVQVEPIMVSLPAVQKTVLPPVVETKIESVEPVKPVVALPPVTKPVVAQPPVVSEKKASPVNRVSKKAPTLSRTEQAAHIYQTALQALHAGEIKAAEKALQQALLLNPQLLDARIKLIGLLQKDRRDGLVEDQLQQGLKLHPNSYELRKSYARHLLQAGRVAAAVQALRVTPLPDVAKDHEYHALLGALLQEAGDYPAAVATYRQLLEYSSAEPLWWIGLAISLDQSGAAVKAKQAYQQALDLPGLQVDLQNYAHNRLQAL